MPRRIPESELGRISGIHMRSTLLAEHIRREAVDTLCFADEIDVLTQLALLHFCSSHHDASWWLLHKRPFAQNTCEYWTNILRADIQKARAMLVQKVSISHSIREEL